MSDSERYVKTPKGLEEVTQRSHGLPLRCRRLLIMIDGKKDAANLAAMLPGEDTAVVLARLLDGGYITPLAAEPSPAEQAAATASQAPRPENDAQRFDMARNFMLNTLNAFVGISASGLIVRIEACAGIGMLQEHYRAWQDAIRLSSDGRKRLTELESRLAPLLS
ncbi:MAG TPA: hypothetical protein VFF82_06280 [Rhodocyclaceae bacterium]|nr:hypothetical protein [Rhodocyclaceae bacterium]